MRKSFKPLVLVAMTAAAMAGPTLADGDGGDNAMTPKYGDSWADLQAHNPQASAVPSLQAQEGAAEARANPAHPLQTMRDNMQRMRDRMMGRSSTPEASTAAPAPSTAAPATGSRGEYPSSATGQVITPEAAAASATEGSAASSPASPSTRY